MTGGFSVPNKYLNGIKRAVCDVGEAYFDTAQYITSRTVDQPGFKSRLSQLLGCPAEHPEEPNLKMRRCAWATKNARSDRF